MDSSRLRTGEIVAGIGGVALFVFLFFDWFSGGAAQVSGNIASGTISISHPGISGWDALTDVTGFAIILSGVSGIALACLAAAGQRVNVPMRRGAFTAVLGVLAVLLILWKMVAGSPTLKVGIFLGLGAAIAIAAGALMVLAEDGYEPLVPVGGGARTRSAAASAPPATPAPPPATTPARSASRSGGSRSSGSTTTRKRSTAKKPAARSGSKAKTKSKAKSASSRSSSTRKKTSSRSSAGKRSSSSKKK